MSKYQFSAPGYYRIIVQGSLCTDWSDRFSSMRVVSSPSWMNTEVTVLQGRVVDQTELSSILNTIYELHFSLMSVEYLGDKDSSLDTTNH